MIFLSRVLLVATLLRGINGAIEATGALRSSRLAPLKPFNTRNKPQTVIRVSNGCCPSGYYCDLDGCCPNGEVCTGSSGECVNAGDFPCPDDDGCCPDGDTCCASISSAIWTSRADTDWCFSLVFRPRFL
ncbi:hypothetical protein B0H16DRAFT_1527709 [Mycena metata]|uniref:Granulins domain-containing protein n=1 Tax=Mycena metata TaxID=1033252 RepID=A0AAD7JET5_9AGAR|nr:hypothetical protein B0H16DRAFT_1527709 [Mycena metata]